MRYAIISDIHGNLQAAEAVLGLIERLDIGQIVCLGDIVGYGGDPSHCVDLIRRFCPRVIIGNHDAGAVGLTSVDYFNPAAREAVLWTDMVLSDEERNYLKNLPYEMDFEDFQIVHSTPDDPAQWKYLLVEEEAGPLFDFFNGRLLFYGHTHVPVVFRRDAEGTVHATGADDFILEKQVRYIVNVGSVGQPRDGDPRATFAVYESESEKVTFYREPYDIAAAQKRILQNDLPQMLAIRLAFGR